MRKVFVSAVLLSLASLAAGPKFDTNKMIGGANAPITLEVFSSFDCPHCRIFHEDIAPRLMNDYVLHGKLCLISREFPLPPPAHPYARDVAVYATAAARLGKYQVVADTMFRTQNSWAVSGRWWEAMASVLTADEQKKVQALAKDPGVQAEVQNDLAQGEHDGVNSTPTIFMTAHGQRTALPPGSPNYELLKSLLDNSLSK
ncbi:MAG: thioredoxin domain-containing protein [Bryobacteraceae bacterium]|jgi:protein-disulfide isomerase